MRKKIIRVIPFVLAALLIGGLYIWYSHTYGNAGPIKLQDDKKITYEWQQIASECNITGDYLWSRTKKLMIQEAEDGVLIPSSYMIEGRLTSEPSEESGVYLPSDQALLMKLYVRDNDRFAAVTLKNKVIDSFNMEDYSVEEQMAWLEGYVVYYSAYGTSEDYKNIKELVAGLFTDDGMVRTSDLTAASYSDSAFQSVTVAESDPGYATFDSPAGTSEDELYSFEGITLASVRLMLIRSLEANELLPEGSFDRNLELVLGGMISDDIPLFAYAARYEEDGTVSYVYSKDHAASVSVVDSIRVMRSLAETDSLPVLSYNWLKNAVLNQGALNDTYYLVTGNTDGSEAVDAYTDIMYIAFYRDDIDLYSNICGRLGSRVATYNSSPALSMIYRTQDDRYYFVARENLEVCLMVR